VEFRKPKAVNAEIVCSVRQADRFLEGVVLVSAFSQL
jgi:hypothetical protein